MSDNKSFHAKDTPQEFVRDLEGFVKQENSAIELMNKTILSHCNKISGVNTSFDDKIKSIEIIRDLTDSFLKEGL